MFEDKDYGKYFAELEKRSIAPSNASDNFKKTADSENCSVKRVKTKGKNSKKVRAIIARTVFCILCAAVILTVAILITRAVRSKNRNEGATSQIKSASSLKSETSPDFFAKTTDKTATVGEEIKSASVIFIDTQSNTVAAQRESDLRCYPASTTKIMTLLVAVENIKDFNDTFKMTYNITDPLFEKEATVAGFISGETVNMYDLLYGTILPSGGDAAIALATKISGSEAAFVKLMNERANQMGLKNTRFTNCTGLYDSGHYTTAADLAVILRYAMKNNLCRKILTAQYYTSSSTSQHPDGIDMLSTLFKYMYGTEPGTATIEGGKTGYTNESGYCIATFGRSLGGKEYVCVALNAPSKWPAVYDQINLYKAYAK